MITLIGMFIGLATLTVLAVAIAAIINFKWLALVIPLLCAGWFAVLVQTPNYFGYAVDQNFVVGQEAVIMSATITDKWIYVLGIFPNNDEPRLIRLAATEENKNKFKQIDPTRMQTISFGGSKATVGDSQTQTELKASFDVWNPDQSKLLSKN